MRIIIRSIDFTTNSLAIELRPSFSLRSYASLASYVAFCKQLGFSNLSLFYPKFMSLPSFKMLQQLEKQFDLSIYPVRMAAHRLECCPSSDFEFRHDTCPGTNDDYSTSLYHVRFTNLENVDDYVTRLVLVTGNACLVDERILSHLRLCSYELSMNTLEHARFATSQPYIELELICHDKWIELNYKDNAEPFNTLDQASFSLEEKVQKGAKRGLGLYILKKIAQKLNYKRDGDCNVTSLRLLREKDAPLKSRRKITMKEFSVSVVPMDSEDLAMLEVTGSIDSTSTPVMESHFDLLIKNHQYQVIVDLSKAEFISSSGIGMFLGTLSTLRKRGGNLILMNVPNLIDEVLEILNLKDHFEIIADLDELRTQRKG